VTTGAGLEVGFVLPPGQPQKHRLKHVLRIRGTSCNSVSRPKYVLMVLAKEQFQPVRRVRHWSKVLYRLHIVLRCSLLPGRLGFVFPRPETRGFVLGALCCILLYG